MVIILLCAVLESFLLLLLNDEPRNRERERKRERREKIERLSSDLLMIVQRCDVMLAKEKRRDRKKEKTMRAKLI